jgi:hypothetical protein
MAREQFELSDTQSALLGQLMQECDLPTKKAVVENALVIFGWAVREVRGGRSIAAISAERKVYRDLLMPALEAVRQKQLQLKHASA